MKLMKKLKNLIERFLGEDEIKEEPITKKLEKGIRYAIPCRRVDDGKEDELIIEVRPASEYRVYSPDPIFKNLEDYDIISITTGEMGAWVEKVGGRRYGYFQKDYGKYVIRR